MTQEMYDQLAQLLKIFTAVDLTLAITLLLSIPAFIFNIFHYVKMKNWRNEYYLTLTEEQRKAIQKYKELQK